ncbi:MAG: coproporphyrinogen III oxidase, partial [Deltaproteobacteria bacterium]|nr:coproporphyrinogen III oxidase [Deltaproteobacteria bacterium]
EAIPGPVERVELFLLAHRVLTEAGYQAIGMDHFALQDDELAVAQRAGRLHRNFMGYTTRPGLEIVGLGMSAISEMAGCYVQDKGRLARWWNAVEQGTSCVEKGWVLTEEDQLRRDVINALMCNFTVRFADLEAVHDIDFERHFAQELRALEPLVKEGLAERHPDRIDITELGRLLVRNVAMVFDAYLPAPDRAPEERPRFSQTV